MSDRPLLKVQDLTKRYGSLRAVDDVSIEVSVGERRAVIGPNGAGKTTLFNLIAGHLPPTSGSIFFRGGDVTSSSEHHRARLGMAKTFQTSTLLEGMPVLENVAVSVLRRKELSSRWFAPWASHASVVDEARDVLSSMGMELMAAAVPSQLSHGDRRSLEIALALALRPDLLLLDEPAAGMSMGERERLVALVSGLPEEMTVLIIEHDLDVVYSLADSITVMQAGAELITGTASEVAASAAVQSAYLGGA